LTTVIFPDTVTGIRAVMPALQFDLVLACTHWTGGAWQDVGLLLLAQVTTAGISRWPVASGVQGTVSVPILIEMGPELLMSPQAFPSRSARGAGDVGRPTTEQLALPPALDRTMGDFPSSATNTPTS